MFFNNRFYSDLQIIFAPRRMKLLMKLYLLFAILTLLNISAIAQDGARAGKITGKIIDSVSKNPIEYATISLFIKGNKKPVNGATSNDAGQFVITGVNIGDYTMLIESIGYKSFSLGSISFAKKN